MAYSLPYFKFNVSAWISGKITLENMDVQGLFINICALYWSRNGALSLTETKRRLTKAKPNAFKSLLKSGLVIVKSDKLEIAFLDEQLKEFENRILVNTANGRLGGRPKKPNANRTLTETKGIREEKTREDKSEIREYGPTHSHFVIVKSKYLHEQSARINGKAGLIAYMEANQTILNLPDYADKFMRNNNGKVFNELSHLQNSYSLFTQKQ